jgi:hypothetical protein
MDADEQCTVVQVHYSAQKNAGYFNLDTESH